MSGLRVASLWVIVCLCSIPDVAAQPSGDVSAGLRFIEGREWQKALVAGGDVTFKWGLFGGGEFSFASPRVDAPSASVSRDPWAMFMAHVGVRYPQRPGRGLQPFAVLGYGVLVDNGNYDLLSYGAGARYWLGDRIAPFAEWRRLEILDVSSDPGRHQVSIGLTFRP